MKTIITIRERIAVRAYFAWQNSSTAGAGVDAIADRMRKLPAKTPRDLVAKTRLVQFDPI